MDFLGRNVEPTLQTHFTLSGAVRRSGHGYASKRVHTCVWSLGYVHIFHSVRFPASHAQGSTFHQSGWDSRDRSRDAWVSLALNHLALRT